MNDRKHRLRATVPLVLIAVVPALAGCAHVNEETFANELDLLREEMRAQDDAVEARVGDRMDERIDEMGDDIDARLSMLESELGALRNDFQVTVERLESAIRFNTPIHFAFDDAAIGSEDQDLLDHFAQVVRGYYDQAIITVEGFTDPTGSVEYNLALGEWRAEAVRDYLETAGIPADRMRAVSYGEDPDRQIVPDAAGPGDRGWENRRVSMVIDFNGSVGATPVALN